MNTKNDEWDDYDFDESLEEIWDEDISDEEINVETINSESDNKPSSNNQAIAEKAVYKSKRKGPLAFIFCLAVLGAAIATYYLITSDKTETLTPVVKLSGVSEPQEKNIQVQDTNMSQIVIDSEISKQQKPEPIKIEAVEKTKLLQENIVETVNTDQEEAVLTPLPKNTTREDIALPDLFTELDSKKIVNTETPENSVGKSSQNVSRPTITEQKPLAENVENKFIEEDILLKTEENFDKKIISAPPSKPETQVLEQDISSNIEKVVTAGKPKITKIQETKDTSVDVKSKKVDVVNKEISTPAKNFAKPTNRSWVIRAAQPGKAVLYDTKTGEIRSIEAGDRVQGVGKIQSISKKSGKWIVQGSQKTISR